MISAQKNLWQGLPDKPGVYLFKDVSGQILYVGKALNLKSRVGSYFSGKNNDRPWIQVMMGFVHNVETIVVTNEVEALMLEATLIKQHLPRFNIKLTDDKAYPFLKVVLNEAIPRFTVTRKRNKDKAIYFGPYLSGRDAINTLEFLRKIYGIHISSTPLRPNRDRACLSCQLGEFTCPLSGEVDEESYQERVDRAIEFLQGKRKHLVDDLDDRMRLAAKNEQYELAAKLRDRLQSVEQILSRQKVISTIQDDYDVIAAAQTQMSAAVSVLMVREGRVTGQKTFYFQLTGSENQNEVVRSFIISAYQNFSEIPGLVALSEEISDQDVIAKFLGTVAGKKVELRTAERGEKRQMVELAARNAAAKLETRLLRTDQSFKSVVAVQELLKLPALPTRIEAVDISNLGSSEPVGATVCYVNGKPDKNEYRRYKIKTVEGQNDFAMIREVMHRRFSDTTRTAPDIMVIDGGVEQLKSALEGIKDAPIQPKTIIALAKKPDRVFLPGRKLPIAVTRGHKGLLLLSRIRDEVHRFAIGFQRKRQSKKSLSTQ
ncbi:MAG: excinuclease ABC subunit UvrC [Candidatus Berkelbacteria bacterium]|nr:MAG: excinuclease ABC subunit UvrC [Candidatus Berkelbacteria bacterium]QQG52034.1 MAG: excinuclease ABC subunit UvrC [Candidatus Berkelbacteria bacterium]